MLRSLAATAIAAGLLIVPASASADTTTQNVAKYHALRARLVTDFVHVGSGPGGSEPADVRSDAQGFIKWADNTIRLGWYIGVLASEYYLSQHAAEFPNAKGSEDTLSELYLALLAMERLDLDADAAFPECGGSAPSLNGFFVRDDVPAGFHAHFPPLTTTFSDFVDPALTNKEESQDQVYHVLMGLALVKHLVPAGVTQNGKSIRAWAIEQAKRIVEHMAATDWTIKNPACSDRTVQRGPDARVFSTGTSKAIGFITDGAYAPSANGLLGGLWGAVKDSVGATDIDNQHMAMAIAAVGNGWDATTADDLYKLSQAPDWPLYPILHRALHADVATAWCTSTGAPTNASARKMLDELPAGADIASPRPGGPAVHPFTRSLRFLRGTETAYTGEPGSDGQRYSGLDYMLLHNLYAIATPSTWEGGSLFGAGICATVGADGGAPPSDGGTPGASSSSSGAAGPGDAPGTGPDTTGTTDGGGCACGVSSANSRGFALTGLGALALALRLMRRHDKRKRS
jgi:hypothetical protein